jgi:sortase (surface protein transpeptidase)
MTTPAWIKKLRFSLIAGGLYLGTIGFIGYVAISAYTPRSIVLAKETIVTSEPQKAESIKAAPPAFIPISGKPVRLVIPSSNIDLPIDEGFYNEADGSWTLSDSRLQYAMMTQLANNHSGNTFIYGHATDQVLGILAKQPPAAGSIAQVYTDNGHLFTYTFTSSRSLTPDDTSIFSYNGPPILTVQTCTGSVSEWRTMFTFTFDKVTTQ